MIVNCDNCEKEIYKIPSVANSGNNFCDRECYYESRKGKIPNGSEKVEVSCNNCGSKFKRAPSKVERSDHHFCSTDCQNIWQSEYQSGKQNPMYSCGKIKTSCDQCCNFIKRFSSHVGENNFCSKECHYKSMEKEWPRYFYHSSAWKNKRKEIRERDGCCVWCGKKNDLYVHHMNPISNGGDRLKNTNLITLCPRCHGIAHGALSV